MTIEAAYSKTNNNCATSKAPLKVPSKFHSNLCAVIAVGDVKEALTLLNLENINNPINQVMKTLISHCKCSLMTQHCIMQYIIHIVT